MSDKIEVNRRRVLGGLVTIGAAGAAVGAGTFALFSDEETSTGNTLTAGEIDLALGDSSTIEFTNDDIKPTDSGETFADLDRVDSSDINADLDIRVTSVSATQDELDDQLNLKLWVGTGGASDDEFTSGDDIYLDSGGGTTTSDDGYAIASNFDGMSWSDVMTNFNGPATFNVEWEFPDLGENNDSAQGDDITIEFAFDLVQQQSN